MHAFSLLWTLLPALAQHTQVMMPPLRIALMLGAVLSSTLSAEETAATIPVYREHEFFEKQLTLTNPHDRAVRIAYVDKSCSCERLSLATHFLLPHESTTIDFKVSNTNASGTVTRRMWFYLSDPDFEAIELAETWTIIPDVAVDAVPENATDVLSRPEKRYQDIYLFSSAVRPDELGNLREIVRLSCPENSIPEGGLSVSKIDYSGQLWTFEQRQINDGALLLIATAKDPTATIESKVYNEQVVLHTNHPHKPIINLQFDTTVNETGKIKDSLDLIREMSGD